MRVGVVDVGTNSVRLLVADAADGLVDVERSLTITRLGEGVDGTRRLGDAPLARTVDAIASYVDRARALEAGAIRIIATSAVRDAANRDAFLEAVRARTGVDADVISGDEEASLGFAGAIAGTSLPGPFVVLDIGGGSTELVYGSDRAERFVSLDIGSVRLTERHLAHDPPTDVECAAVRADADAAIERARAIIGPAEAATLIGLAGTITTVAAIAQDLRVYDRARIHGAVLSRDQIATVRARLGSMTSLERRGLPVMPAGREDVIVGGVLILEQVMDAFGRSACTVSESDILDGTAGALVAGTGYRSLQD